MVQPLPSFKHFVEHRPQQFGLTGDTFLLRNVSHKNTQTGTADKISAHAGPALQKDATFLRNLESYKFTMELDGALTFCYKCGVKLQWMSVLQFEAFLPSFHLPSCFLDGAKLKPSQRMHARWLRCAHWARGHMLGSCAGGEKKKKTPKMF